jgi:hypothetical protein
VAVSINPLHPSAPHHKTISRGTQSTLVEIYSLTSGPDVPDQIGLQATFMWSLKAKTAAFGRTILKGVAIPAFR